MSTRFYNPPTAPAPAADIHPSWCDCAECATAWDATHKRDLRALWIGTALGLIAVAVLWLTQGGAA
jgi:hypothetical protein